MEVSSKQNITTQKATSKKGGLRTMPFIIGDCLLRSFLGQNAQYHLFLKFLATEHCFGNCYVSEIIGDLPLFLILELGELEYHIF